VDRALLDREPGCPFRVPYRNCDRLAKEFFLNQLQIVGVASSPLSHKLLIARLLRETAQPPSRSNETPIVTMTVILVPLLSR
jgi:hypothetical protein